MTIDNTKDNKFIKNSDETLKIMTVKDQLKVLDNKIRQNQADYDLYRKNAKISALSSRKLDKYEYLTVKILGIDQVLYKKQSLNIPLWVKCLIKD